MNNGEIEFPFSEAEKYGIEGATFNNGIIQLVDVGFIDINRPGHYPDISTTYFISDRYIKFGTEEFIRKAKKQKKLTGEMKQKFLDKMKKK